MALPAIITSIVTAAAPAIKSLGAKLVEALPFLAQKNEPEKINPVALAGLIVGIISLIMGIFALANRK